MQYNSATSLIARYTWKHSGLYFWKCFGILKKSIHLLCEVCVSVKTMADLKGGAGKIIHHVCLFFVFFKYRNSYCVTLGTVIVHCGFHVCLAKTSGEYSFDEYLCTLLIIAE